MNSSPRIKRSRIEIAIAVLALLVLLTVASSCTITPATVSTAVPSFDGNAQNSGLLGYTAEGFGVITPHAYQRYNALAAHYGQRFAPPVHPGDGCQTFTNGTWLIDNQHEVYFKTMARWRREGK